MDEHGDQIVENGVNQIFPCRWPDCVSPEFRSELDMGLHVLATHTNVFKHGHFVLTRGVIGPATRERETEARQDEVEEEDSPRKRKRSNYNFSVPQPIKRPTSDLGDNRRQGEVKMSQVAVDLLRRLQTPAREPRLFQTEHFCVICQVNYQKPCNKDHNPNDLQLVAEWKRLYGHLVPKKKALITQIRKMKEKYLEQEAGGDFSVVLDVKHEPEDASRGEREADQPGPAPPPVIEEPEARGDAPGEEEDPKEEEQDEDLEEQDNDGDSGEDEEEEEEEEAPEQHEVAPGDIPEAEEFRVGRNGAPKISRIIASLIFRLRSRGSFRATDRSRFCLMCLSFRECRVEHSALERRLEKTWRKYFGKERVTADSLIEQLGHLKVRYIRMENQQ